MVARIIFVICFIVCNILQAAYFDEISIMNNGNLINATNPIGVRLTDGTSYLTNLPVSQSGTWNINSITNPVAATQSGTWNITNISGTVSLPTGAATSALQTSGNSSLTSIDNKTPALVGANQPAVLRDSSNNELFSTDLDNSGGVSKVLGVTLRTLTNGTPVEYGTASNPLRVDVTGSTVQPVSQSGSWTVTANAGTNLNTSALALETTQSTQNTRIGDLTETAPASDTASSGLNGRLQRIAQRITDLIAVFNPLTAAPANNASGIVVRPLTSEYATFSVVSTATTVGNNKSMLAIQNTGTSVVRIREIWIINDQTTAVTGVAGSFQVLRIASFTGGTSLTIGAFDSTDTLPSGITAATGATVSTETTLLRQGVWSTDEWGPGTADTESFDHAIQNTEPFWKQTPGGKAITIRQNQAVHVKFATNSTAGAFNIRLIFTTE
jgi:hypothetical protein